MKYVDTVPEMQDSGGASIARRKSWRGSSKVILMVSGAGDPVHPHAALSNNRYTLTPADDQAADWEVISLVAGTSPVGPGNGPSMRSR